MVLVLQDTSGTCGKDENSGDASTKASATDVDLGISFTYAGWNIGMLQASTGAGYEGKPINVQLEEGVSVAYQGWWPKQPTTPPKVIIAGCCLYDYRWQLRFAKRGKGNPPSSMCLASSKSRSRALSKLRDGQTAVSVVVPRALGTYHTKLINWQVDMIRELQPEQVFYHVPVAEYHSYIDELEQGLGRTIPKLHSLLDEFASTISDLIMERCKSCARVSFIEPPQDQLSSPIDSFLWPYMNINRIVAESIDQIIGLEDIPELRLVQEAAIRSGYTIPVKCAVLDMTDPFRFKDINASNVLVFDL